jgi:hypothetical protein
LSALEVLCRFLVFVFLSSFLLSGCLNRFNINICGKLPVFYSSFDLKTLIFPPLLSLPFGHPPEIIHKNQPLFTCFSSSATASFPLLFLSSFLAVVRFLVVFA